MRQGQGMARSFIAKCLQIIRKSKQPFNLINIMPFNKNSTYIKRAHAILL